jgi:hypothetical protein
MAFPIAVKTNTTIAEEVGILIKYIYVCISLPFLQHYLNTFSEIDTESTARFDHASQITVERSLEKTRRSSDRNLPAHVPVQHRERGQCRDAPFRRLGTF